MADLVSILIPAYNAERWIGETVESALAQTWARKEIIIVDDGSRDGTLQLARSFEGRSVKVVTQPNSGAAAARNRALSLAQGDYIQWLDADDLLEREKISRQLARRDSGNDSRVLLTAAFGTFFYRPQKAQFRPTSLWQDLGPVDWILARFNDDVWMNPVAWLVTRTLTDLAGPWDARLSTSGDDDGEYVCRVVAASEHVNFVQDAKCYYREGHSGRLSSRRAASAYEAFLLSTRLCIDHLLALEDSPRTRAACVKLIENRLVYYYPDKPEMLRQLDELARSLGASQLTMKETWKYKLVGRYLGWRSASALRNAVFNLKTRPPRAVDRILYALTRQQDAWRRPGETSSL